MPRFNGEGMHAFTRKKIAQRLIDKPVARQARFTLKKRRVYAHRKVRAPAHWRTACVRQVAGVRRAFIGHAHRIGLQPLAQASGHTLCLGCGAHDCSPSACGTSMCRIR